MILVIRRIGILILVGILFQISAVAGGMQYTIENTWFGSYYTISYAGEQYFAGYGSPGGVTTGLFTYNATSNSGQLFRVLMNDNITRVLNMGDSLSLGEGYQFKVKDVADSDSLGLVSLLNNGDEIDLNVLQSGQTYVYGPSKVGDIRDLPIIIIHVSDINNVSETVTINGVFQLSENFITVPPPPDTPPSPAPEMPTIALMGLGMFSLLFVVKKKK